MGCTHEASTYYFIHQSLTASKGFLLLCQCCQKACDVTMQKFRSIPLRSGSGLGMFQKQSCTAVQRHADTPNMSHQTRFQAVTLCDCVQGSGLQPHPKFEFFWFRFGSGLEGFRSRALLYMLSCMSHQRMFEAVRLRDCAEASRWKPQSRLQFFWTRSGSRLGGLPHQAVMRTAGMHTYCKV